MSREIAKQHLEKYGYGDKILDFEVSSATVALAAIALGCEEARIAKTLSFLVDDNCVLIVAAGDAKIDNSKYKGLFHTKAKMLTPEQVTSFTGHAIGGVCPFANPEGIRTFLDISLRRFDTVYPAAGSSNSAIELTCEELESYSNCQGWVDLCKGWQECEV